MDAKSGLVHTVIATAANVNDVAQGYAPGKAPRTKAQAWGTLNEQAEKFKASVPAKVEHPLRVKKGLDRRWPFN